MVFQNDAFQCAAFQGIPCGQGSVENPFIITSFSELELIGGLQYPLTGCYKLGANINATPTQNPTYNEGAGWEPIGSVAEPFTGRLDGNGKTIDGLYINRPTTDDVGLFGCVQSDPEPTEAWINDLKLTNVDITGQDNVGTLVGSTTMYPLGLCKVFGTINGRDYLGGIIGNFGGGISNSSFSGTINGGDFLGGIAGTTTGGIFSCSSFGEINGTNSLGGNVGLINTNVIWNSYSHMDIVGTDKLGGLIGDSQASSLSYCYSAGNVDGATNLGGLVGVQASSNVTSCYWDIQTSGLEASALGEGKTTTQLTTLGTFTDWDFETIWISTEDELAEAEGYSFVPSGGAQITLPMGESVSEGLSSSVITGAKVNGTMGNAIFAGNIPVIKVGAIIELPIGEAFLEGMPPYFPNELDIVLYDLIPYQITRKFVHYVDFKLRAPDNEAFTITSISAKLNNRIIPVSVKENDLAEITCEMVIDTNDLKSGWKKLDINVITENNSNQFRRYIMVR